MVLGQYISGVVYTRRSSCIGRGNTHKTFSISQNLLSITDDKKKIEQNLNNKLEKCENAISIFLEKFSYKSKIPTIFYR